MSEVGKSVQVTPQALGLGNDMGVVVDSRELGERAGQGALQLLRGPRHVAYSLHSDARHAHRAGQTGHPAIVPRLTSQYIGPGEQHGVCSDTVLYRVPGYQEAGDDSTA